MSKGVGKYKVLGRLGRGGMGEVYRAQQVELQREVALKVLSEDASAQKATERFLREAKMLARLDHPNLVRIYDAGKNKGRLFFAMELVEGRTLTRVLAKDGRPHPSFTARVGAQMCSAFAYFHALEMIHRDIKPSNIMVTGPDEETIKIMDFGIATEKGAERLTRTRAVVGTARYLSPEMARGEQITGKSDVYQLGLVLYELLCGAPPMSGPAAVAIARRAAGEPTPDPRKTWPACPARLAQAVNLCLESDPEDRPTAQEMIEEFQAIERLLKGWEPPEGPLEPWTSEHDEAQFELAEDDPIPVRDSAALPGSGRYSEQNELFEEDFPYARIAASVALVLVILYLGWWWATPVEYQAAQLVITRGARGVVLTWSSENAYESKVVFGKADEGSAGRLEVRAEDDGRNHRLPIDTVEPGERYEFRVVFPDGRTSLDYNFTAPPTFAILRPRFQIVGPDRVEWRFQTPVPVQARLEIVSHGGETLERKEGDPTEDHVFRFTFDEMLRDPRKLVAHFEAADGPVEAEFPQETTLSLVGHVTRVFSEERVRWGDFFSRIEEQRLDTSRDWRGQNLPEFQQMVQRRVKDLFGKSGVMDNWASVSPRLGDYLLSQAPWPERARLLDSLMKLRLLDRLYELISITPFFQIDSALLTVVRSRSGAPDWNQSGIRENIGFPYNANLLVPENYSERARGRMNTAATTFFPKKGKVRTELIQVVDLPDQPWSETALGLEARGIYPFLSVLVDVACAGQDWDQATTYPFLSDKELTDIPISNEIDLLKFSRGAALDDVFPPRIFWMALPPEALCPGENKLRVRLHSIQHISIFPAVCRRLFVRAKPGR